jgi:hypothetical protein
MATNASNVRVGVTGEVSFAPAGTALPTDATTALNAAFTALGYNDENGVTETVDRQSTPIRAWQNGDIVRRVKNSEEVSYTFTLIETTADVLETYYGNFTAVSGSVKVGGQANTRGAWSIQVVDGADILRIVIPDGEVTELGTVQYNDDATGYTFTVTAYPDATLDANAIKYYDALTTP